MAAAASAPLAELAPLTPRLDVLNADDQRTVFVNGHVVGRYACDDRGTERVMVTQLAEVLTLPDREIAAAFDLHPVTLSRLRGHVRQGGAAALMPRRTGPKGPHKMTPRLAARCRQLRAQGHSFRESAARISRADRPISHVTVAALFKGSAAAPTPQRLGLESAALLEPPGDPLQTASRSPCPRRSAPRRGPRATPGR